MSRLRRIAGGLLLAAFAVSATAAHHHSLFADIYEGGSIEADHVHVLSSHDPRSHATHFHAILGTERDACTACHGIRGLDRPAPAGALGATAEAERVYFRPTSRALASPRPSGSSRAPPASA